MDGSSQLLQILTAKTHGAHKILWSPEPQQESRKNGVRKNGVRNRCSEQLPSTGRKP